MRSRATLATLAVGALAIGGLFGHGAKPKQEPAPTGSAAPALQRPNILMITADDLAVGDLAYMPHVKNLLTDEGTDFTSAIAPTPLCVPARASLLSGQYAQNHHALSITGTNGGWTSFDNQDTVATALQAAGYYTSFAGKYINGYGDAPDNREVEPPGWDDWRATVGKSTYLYYGPLMNQNGIVARVGDPKVHTSKNYTTNIMSSIADQDIARAKSSGKPWFTWVNYVAPHTGGPHGPDDPKALYAGTKADYGVPVPDPRDRNTMKHLLLPQKANMFLEDTSGLPDESPSQRRFDADQRKALPLVYERRIESAKGLDRAVEAQIKALKRTRQLANTLVVFTSDNGYAVGEHNINGKLWHYDDIARIPVILRGPGVPGGKRVGTAVGNPDLATTILALAGAAPPKAQDGNDIWPYLTQATQLRYLPIAGWPTTTKNTTPAYVGVRFGAWTYVRFRKGGVELYDRHHDPQELHNLAGVAKYAGVQATLARATDLYRDCQGTSCPHQTYPETSPDQTPPEVS